MPTRWRRRVCERSRTADPIGALTAPVRAVPAIGTGRRELFAAACALDSHVKALPHCRVDRLPATLTAIDVTPMRGPRVAKHHSAPARPARPLTGVHTASKPRWPPTARLLTSDAA